MRKIFLIAGFSACLAGLAWWFSIFYSGKEVHQHIPLTDSTGKDIPAVPVNNHPTHKVENVKE